jgi:hypothetical protein
MTNPPMRNCGTSAAAYSLFADQLSPGFDHADFEMGYRDTLQHEYPAFAPDIARLTRAEFAVSPPGGARSVATQAAATPGAAPNSNPVPPKGIAFSDAGIEEQTVVPGVVLKELVGRKSPLAQTPRLSVARFAPADAKAVGPGSTVFIPATLPHSIEADPGNDLVFLAISAPAFTPEDYVLVKP